MSIGRFKTKIKGFFGRFDRTYLGPRWMKMSSEQRTDGVGFIEHKNSNIHAHFALCTPPNAYLWNIKIHTEKYWGKICPSGSHDVRMISGPLRNKLIILLSHYVMRIADPYSAHHEQRSCPLLCGSFYRGLRVE